MKEDKRRCLDQTSFTAPEFHAALEVRVEDPHTAPPKKVLDEACISEVILLHDGEDKDEAREEDECEKKEYSRRYNLGRNPRS